MAESADLQQLVETTVSQVLTERLAELRREIAERLTRELEPLLAPASATSEGGSEAPPTALLDAAVSSVQDGTTQGDILRAMLQGAAQFSGRAGLFVVKGGNLQGWRALGFPDDEAVKNLTLDGNSGLAGRALRDHGPVAAAAVEFDSQFIASVGNPVDGNALVLPLVVKDKTAALLYADAGTHPNGRLDPSALQLLVRSTGLWIELLSLRKSGGVAEPPPPTEPLPVEKAAAAVAAAPRVEAPPPPPPPPPAAAAASAAGAGPAPEALSPEEQEIQKKAKRFAKLLVDEIKLYNQKKVAEGRQNRDLYDRLKEDIEKSRGSYDKRYAGTAAASADYFTQEVIRILAENDKSLLGSNFPH